MNDQRWRRPASLTGAVFVALVVAGSAVDNSSLDDRSTGREVLDWYIAHRSATEIAALLVLCSVVIGLAFYVLLRDHLRTDPQNATFANAMLVGATLFGAGGALDTGFQFVIARAPRSLDPSAAQALNSAAWATHLLQDVGIGLLALASGLAILRSAVLPKWLGWVALVIAASAVVPADTGIPLLATGLWTFIVSIVMFRRPAPVQPTHVEAVAVPA